MDTSTASFSRQTQDASARTNADRRRYKRVHLNLLGRFMRQDEHEYPCKLNDISVGGASLFSPVSVVMGERVIAYIDQIGRVEGNVKRVFEDGFAIDIQATRYRREKMAAQLTWLLNRQSLKIADERRHGRLVPKNEITELKLADGITIQCRLLDVSLSGASVETTARPELGHEVMLGKLKARVSRYHDNGIGVEFMDIQNPSALRKYFG